MYNVALLPGEVSPRTRHIYRQFVTVMIPKQYTLALDIKRPGRFFVCTDFQTAEAFPNLEAYGVNEQGATDIRWISGQREFAPSTGKHHFQFYIEFRRPVRGSWIRKCLEPAPSQGLAFFHRAKNATRGQARKYCGKEFSEKNAAGEWVLGSRARATLASGEEARPFSWGTHTRF